MSLDDHDDDYLGLSLNTEDDEEADKWADHDCDLEGCFDDFPDEPEPTCECEGCYP